MKREGLLRLYFVFLGLFFALGIPDDIEVFFHQLGGRLIYWKDYRYWYWQMPLFNDPNWKPAKPINNTKEQQIENPLEISEQDRKSVV